MASPVLSLRWCLTLAVLVVGFSACRCDGEGGGVEPPPPVKPVAPDAARSRVEADRTTGVVANGRDAAILTVTVVGGPQGEALADRTVTLQVSGEGNTVSPLQGTTDANGVMTARLVSTRTGSKRVQASVEAEGGPVVLSTQPVIEFVPPPATRLAFTATRLQATAGEPLSPVVEVVLLDEDGQPAVGEGRAVTVELATGPASAELQGPLTVNAVDGVARFSGLVLEKAGTGYSLRARASPLAPALSPTFDVAPAAAAAVELTGLPDPMTAGSPAELHVLLTDAFGNVATTYTGTLRFTSSDPGAVLPAPTALTAADAGRKHFPGVILQQAGAQRVTVVDEARTTLTTFQETLVVAAAPSRLVFTQQPGNHSVRAALGPVRVALLDAFGNPTAAGAPPVTVTLEPASAGLEGPASVAPVSGEATFAGLSVAQEGTGYRLTASASGLVGATSAAFDIVDDVAPARPVLAQGPTGANSLTVQWTAVGDDGSLGTAQAQELRYATFPIVTDADFASATLVPTGAPQPAGSAESAPLTGLTPSTSYHVALKVVDNAGNAVRSATLPVSTANATVTHLAFVLPPENGTAGSALADVQVALLDEHGMTVLTDSSAVTLTLLGGPAFTPVTVRATSGVATFSGLRIDTAGSNYRFEATSGSLEALQSTPFTIQPAAAASLTLAGLSSPVTSGTAATLQVTLHDAFGNVATGYRGTVRFTSSDPAASLPADHTFTADDAGQATVSGLVLETAGPQSVTAEDPVSSALTDTLTVDVVGGPATRLVLSVPTSPVTAGSPFSVQVSLRDAFGNVATGYRGTVRFTSSDPSAVLPADFTFTADDAGQKTFSSVELRTAGTRSLQATDTDNSALSDAHDLSVQAGAVSRLGLSAPATASAGSAVSVTVTAYDAFDNVATGYSGTVHFTSNDPAATLPADYTFTSEDLGSRLFSVTPRMAGPLALTVTDGTHSDSASLTVTPGAATRVDLTGPTGPVTAGTPFQVTVAAYDAFDNVATGYSGTVVFTSSDPAASLPADYTFTADDAGQATVSGLVLETAGARTVTVTDAVLGSLTDTLTVDVVGGPATQLVLSVPTSPVTAGSPFSVQVSLRDAFGNVATGYQGTVRFTSSDPSAVLPADFTFTADDAGQKTFSSVELRTAGTRSLQATDTDNSALSDAHDLSVQAGAVSRLGLSAPATASAGSAVSVTVTAYDAFDNVATGYSGTVHFTSNDPAATLPADYTFTSEDLGSRPFSVTPRTAGPLALTVTDGTRSDSASLAVTPGAATRVDLTGLPGSLTAGTSVPITVTVYDASGNVATGYSGTVVFTSTDPSAVLPDDYTFTPADLGVAHLSVEPRKAGTQTVSVSGDGVGSDSASTTVAPASPVVFDILVHPTSGTVRTALSPVRVAFLDAYDNTTSVSTPAVTLTLVGGNPESVLSGTATVNPNNGVATFSGLSIDQEGTGFRFVVSAPGFPSAPSEPFDIVDNLPPAAVVLTAAQASSSSVALTWLAVGDDGHVGTATRQELRYATSPITTEAAFAAATPVTVPAPKPPGSSESATVTGLVLNVDHYFALKVFDGADNASLSNSPRVAGNACEGVTCTPPATTCSADNRAVVTYTSACNGSSGSPVCQDTPTQTVCPAFQTCSAGACVPVTASSQTGRVIISEFSALGTEFIELRNITAAIIDVQGFSLRNAAGQEVTLRATTDPNGTAGAPVTILPNSVRYGIANPTGAIPGTVGFVYGDPGTPFALADTGDALALYASAALGGKLEDLVDFRSFVTDPNTPLTAARFVGFAGSSTQLEPTTSTAAGNDTATNWCVSFHAEGVRDARVTNTAGGLNGSCKVAVINEVLIDPAGSDDAKAFVEIAGPGGAVIGGAKITDVEGIGSSAGSLNAEGDLAAGETDGEFVIPAGTRIPADGILLIADATTTSTTSVPGYTAGVDVLARDMDMENAGGDAIQLVSATGTLLDTLGHDANGANLTTNTAYNGLAMYEGATALTPASGVNNASPSLARSPLSTDTGNNRNDFRADPSPTPGSPNDAVSFTVASLTPNDGPATSGANNIAVTGNDFSPGLRVQFGTTTSSACTVLTPTSATCIASANTGSAVARVNVTFMNPLNVGAPDVVLANAFTYTGFENETNSAAEADFCNLQFPATFTVKSATATPFLYGRLYEAGLTEAAGAPAGVLAEVGYGTSSSNPTTNNSWRFFAASYNVQVDNNDEFVGAFTAPTVAVSTTYSYTYRFSVDGGLKWTYCDLNGAGSNTGLTLETGQFGVMTVTP